MRPVSQRQSPEESPGFLLWRTTLSWQRCIRAALAPHDLTHVQFVLLASLWWLADHGGEPTQAQLAENAGADPMMTSQVIRKLAARGLLERRLDPADSRARRLRLTASGSALLADALTDVRRADDLYFEALGPDRDSFLSRLAALIAHGS